MRKFVSLNRVTGGFFAFVALLAALLASCAGPTLVSKGQKTDLSIKLLVSGARDAGSASAGAASDGRLLIVTGASDLSIDLDSTTGGKGYSQVVAVNPGDTSVLIPISNVAFDTYSVTATLSESGTTLFHGSTTVAIDASTSAISLNLVPALTSPYVNATAYDFVSGTTTTVTDFITTLVVGTFKTIRVSDTSFKLNLAASTSLNSGRVHIQDALTGEYLVPSFYLDNQNAKTVGVDTPNGAFITIHSEVTSDSYNIFAREGSQTSYYVSNSGSNANPGTAGAPFATITYALTRAWLGETVNVLPGTYDESTETFPLTILTSVSLIGDPATKGLNTILRNTAAGSSAVVVHPQIQTKVEGFTITNLKPQAGPMNNGIVIDTAKVTIRNNRILSNQGNGIELNSAVTHNNIVIENNIINENFASGIQCANAQPIVQNNEIVGNGYGITVYASGLNLGGGSPVSAGGNLLINPTNVNTNGNVVNAENNTWSVLPMAGIIGVGLSAASKTEYLTAGRVLSYGFNNSYNDSSPNNYTAINTGGVSWAFDYTNVATRALYFNGGATSYVSTAQSLNLSTGQVSVSAWITAPASAGLTFISDTSSNFALFQNGNTYGFTISIPVTNSVVTSSLAPGTWRHFVGTYDGVDIKLYVDGNLAGTMNHPGFLSSNVPFVLGKSGATMWTGTVANYRVYDRALTAQEAYNLYYVRD